jgi:hypothetical protein
VAILVKTRYAVTMIRRLFALLLLCALTIPALTIPAMATPSAQPLTAPAVTEAACHDTMPSEMPDSHHRNTPDAPSPHHCIGCIAPFVLPAMTAYAPLPPVPARARAIAALAGLALLPATPPPRTA